LSTAIGFFFSSVRFRSAGLGLSLGSWIALKIVRPQLEREHQFAERLLEKFEADRDGIILYIQQLTGKTASEASREVDRYIGVIKEGYPIVIDKIGKNCSKIGILSSLSLLGGALKLKVYRYRYQLSGLMRTKR
jgi:hypothetical protein